MAMTIADEIDDFLKTISNELRAAGETKAVAVVRYPAESVDGLRRTRFAVHVYEPLEELKDGDAR